MKIGENLFFGIAACIIAFNLSRALALEMEQMFAKDLEESNEITWEDLKKKVSFPSE